MNVKVTEVFPGEQTLSLLLQSIATDTFTDAFGQNSFSGEIDLNDSFEYEAEKVRCQRVFVAVNADTGENLAICFAYPMILAGKTEPKVTRMLRQLDPRSRERMLPHETLKIDLRITDPAAKGRGIGRGFAEKVMRKYLFHSGSGFRSAIALIPRDDAAGVGFAVSLHGKKVAELHGNYLFHFERLDRLVEVPAITLER